MTENQTVKGCSQEKHVHSLKGLKGSPSAWVASHLHLIKPGAPVLDMACGCGRNTAYLAKKGFQVTAVDYDIRVKPYIDAIPNATFMQADLEQEHWPLGDLRFDLIVVEFYLYRDNLHFLPDMLNPGGFLSYETFMMPYEGFDGNRAKSGRFTLQPLELLDLFRDRLSVVAYQQTLGDKGDCFQQILLRKPIDGKAVPVALGGY